jgi:hypothetical protein
MKHLARAVIAAVLFLEFSDDDQVNPDNAVRALEDIAHALAEATPEEIAALRAAIDEDLAQMPGGGSEQVKAFYRSFLLSCGIESKG